MIIKNNSYQHFKSWLNGGIWLMSSVIEIANAMFKDYPDIVSVADLQQIFGIKKTKAYELVQNKTMASEMLRILFFITMFSF